MTPAAGAGAPSPEPTAPYLPPDAAQGCRYCFDPASPLLRRALTGRRPDPIPARALLDDLVFLRRLMEKVYAGYPDLLQHPEFDVDAFFREWMERVRAAGERIGFRAGVVDALRQLRQVVPDNHLIVVGADQALREDQRLAVHEYQTIIADAAVRPDHRALGDLPGARRGTFRLAPLLRSDGGVATALTLSAPGPASALTLRLAGRVLELHRRPPPQDRPGEALDRAAYDWSVIGGTALIALRSFATATMARERLRRFVGDYPEHARQPTLLFDLRDNHGGSLEYIRAWIAQARRGEWRSYARLEVVGALWPCSQWNLVVERQIRARTVGTPEAQAERERLRAEWAGGAPGPSSRLELGLQQGRAANPYAGQVFVLLNRNTGSSGELAALDLKRALGATLLGERSAGTMQYGEVRRFVLPSTGLVCQIPTKRFFFDDEVESVGVPVDAYLERIDQDAVSLIPQLDRLQTALTAGFR